MLKKKQKKASKHDGSVNWGEKRKEVGRERKRGRKMRDVEEKELWLRKKREEKALEEEKRKWEGTKSLRSNYITQVSHEKKWYFLDGL